MLSAEQYLTPDEDLARAITMDELLVDVEADVRELFRKELSIKIGNP